MPASKPSRALSIAAALILSSRIGAGAVSPEELAERDGWVSARIEARPQEARAEAVLVVLANHGPVLQGARAGKPLRIAGRESSRGILCHAPSKVLVLLPAPGDSFTAIAGIDSNEQTSGGRGSVDFSVRAGGAEKFRSGVLREGMPGRPVEVDLAGATEFTIQAEETPDGIACDHSDWLDAKVSLWIPHHGTGLGMSDSYSLRSAFAPAYRIGWDVRDRSIDLALLRRTVEQFRKTEEFWLGDFYPLTRWSLAEDVWIAWQFDRPETGRGFVQAFRRAESPYETARLRLRGLDPEARYQVDDLDRPEEPRKFAGRELLDRGLPISLPDRRSSGLLIYRRSGDGGR